MSKVSISLRAWGELVEDSKQGGEETLPLGLGIRAVLGPTS